MQREPHARNERRSDPPSLLRRFAPSAAVLAVGLLTAFTVFTLQRAAEHREALRAFGAWAEERRDALQRMVESHLQILEGVQALFNSSEYVSPNEFERFTSGSLERYPHVRSLEWLPRVARAEREAFERRAADLLATPFRIIAPARTQPTSAALPRVFWPVFYSRVRDGEPQLGIDAGGAPEHAVAMDTAASFRRPSVVAAARGEAVQHLYIYLPVYGRGSPRTSATLDGFVRIAFAPDEMLKAVFGKAGVQARLTDPRQQALLGTVGAQSQPEDLEPFLEWSGRVRIADRTVTLQLGTGLDNANLPGLGAARAVLAASIAVALLGAFAAFMLTRRRLHLEQLARDVLAENKERRLSEQRLLQSEARYRIVVENSPDAILLNRDGGIRFANSACVRMLGAGSPEELLGKSVFDIVHPDDHDQMRMRIAEMTAAPRVLPPIEQRFVRLDGSIVEVEVLTMPFESEDGLTLQVTARDITQRKAAEIERTQLEAALRQSQKLEAVGTLAGGIAHDFNNILSAIVGNTRMLLEDLPEGDPSARYVAEIRRATHRARDLVKRLMAFSRQQDSQRTAVALEPLLTEVQQLLRATLPAGVELIVRMPPETPPILADATQIHQVLLNLCTNAWQAMSSHSGRIEITVATLSQDAASSRSGVVLDAAQHYVCIGVHDNGVGMSQETLEHIFEPFFTTKQPGEGSGLGLAVVHGIVQSHRGAIVVTSEPGAGASFFVFLPACEAAPPPQAAPAVVASGAPRGAQQHVLYIDDEEPLVFLARRMLERAGYRCTAEADPARAIERVRAAPEAFDLVITDLNMPAMSGLDVAREVLMLRPELSVIITTGYVRADDVAAARELGVRDVILKPDTIDELAASVHRYLPATSHK